MNKEEVLELFRNLKVWKKGDKRAPHKPLLLLYALGRLQRGESGPIPFEDVDQKVGKLLDEFGPPRKTQPILPFWYLQNDGLWELTNISPSPDGSLGSPPTKTFMRSNKVTGKIPDNIEKLLQSDRDLLNQVVFSILETSFPDTIHEDILQAVGLDPVSGLGSVSERSAQKTRDPRFRDKILKAYEYSCAVCGYSIRMGNNPVGLEAAHIKWHQAGGPDEECNGLALCSLHHSLFDRGAFSLDSERKLLVSENAHGDRGFEEWLMRYHGNRIKSPQRSSYYPDRDYTEWHISEVFRGRPREFSLQ
ncbi:MAG: restriction endonuclease [Candidatus Aegiribacteria sp.]|nr:restriction endonuclease [Candidatus Aegiribacteria sp.]